MYKAILAVLLVVAAGAAQAQVAVGDVPPDELGKDRSGTPVRISDHRGKVVVISFWASWCTYCLKELPALESIQKVAGKDQLEVVAVNFKEEAALYRRMLAKLKDLQMTFTHDGNGQLGNRYGLRGLPFLVMIGRDGRVAFTHAGYGEQTLDRIIDEINTLLAAPVPAA
ncbi:TlpA disulfide reductase family protein [Dokdonella koreensis]|uniref:Thioredoxin n=1 Tax=Dokdonella koreensis DS-123 TaxID=1300342 RepID=A0A167G553_9GAMM|nr:TlpA disulfide reductase family protein [Dokdonella koreensis]ANB16168.1 Thioredoxin [Dokdonella koreensis DS-123]